MSNYQRIFRRRSVLLGTIALASVPSALAKELMSSDKPLIADAGHGPRFAVFLRFDNASPQARYAATRLTQVLRQQGHAIVEKPGRGIFVITIAQDGRRLASEEFATTPGSRTLKVAGGDSRGLIYGALTVCEELRNGIALDAMRPQAASAALPFRAIKFNLPWDSYRSSSAIDLHYDTVRDLAFWEAFLDMMAENRFNALTLWNLHPFPYMIRAKNFPEACRFSQSELAEWRNLFQGIFRMAKERGIASYVVNWNILVSPEFSRAHGLKGNNHFPIYKGVGDTSDIIRRYTRESVTQMLEEYEDLTGFGFTLGEQMGGMTPQQRQDWIDETVIAGMKAVKRPVKMIFRAPLSADQGSGGSTSTTNETLTRNAIQRLDGSISEPVWLEIKFNASHGLSTTDLVKTHGGELGNAYYEPLPENYKITWMVRNEDVFALRWGVPQFVREHIEKNGRPDYVGGYFVGSENYIPAKDYFTAVEVPLDWRYAFERQWLYYKLWGRLLYDPSTPDSVFEAEFVRRYGPQTGTLLRAYALASSTQLRFASATDFSWDFTIYGEGMMVFGRKGIQPMSVDMLISQKPLLPNWLSVQDFVERRSAGLKIASADMTPLLLADNLQADCTEALRLIENMDTPRDASLEYEVADVMVWANLGLHYAEKLRGAVALQSFRAGGPSSERTAAIAHLEQSLAYWDVVIAITRPLYKEMPLLHYNGPGNRRNDDNLFHWARLRPGIADDVEVARTSN